MCAAGGYQLLYHAATIELSILHFLTWNSDPLLWPNNPPWRCKGKESRILYQYFLSWFVLIFCVSDICSSVRGIWWQCLVFCFINLMIRNLEYTNPAVLTPTELAQLVDRGVSSSLVSVCCRNFLSRNFELSWLTKTLSVTCYSVQLVGIYLYCAV